MKSVAIGLARALAVISLMGTLMGGVVPSAWAQGEPAAVATAERKVYTLEQAIADGLRRHPTLAAARATARGAQARVDDVKASRRPSLSIAANAGVGGSETTTREWTEPVSAYSASATASWRLWDFGQTRALRQASEASAAAAGSGVAASELDVRTAIANAYVETIARKQLVKVRQDALEREQFYLDQATAFVKAGAKDPIEKAQAQSRVASARTALVRAEGDLDLARANLREAIGIEDPRLHADIVDGWPLAVTAEPAALATFLESAWQNRPEMAQLAEQLRAAELSYRAASREQAPVLAASGSAQQPLFREDDNTPSWQVGLGLSWSIFDGGRRRASERQAQASRDTAAAQRDLLRLRIGADVEAAWVAIRSGRAAVEAANEAVTFAKEQLRLAEARYTQGLGSRIELSEAQSDALTADGQRIEAEWNVAIAWLALERAVGKPVISNM